MIPRADLAVQGPAQDGVRPLLTVKTVQQGTTTDVDVRADFILETLPDSIPDATVTSRSDRRVDGGGAVIIDYT